MTTPPSHWRDDKGQLHTAVNGGLTATVPTRIMVTMTVQPLRERRET